MKATLKNYRQAPRKVRLVADLIRGKAVSSARTTLTFLPKKAAHQMRKLVDSAVANAREKGVTNIDDLVIKRIQVDRGFTFTRYRARSRGRALPIRKQSSHIALELGEQVKKSKKENVKTKKETKV